MHQGTLLSKCIVTRRKKAKVRTGEPGELWSYEWRKRSFRHPYM